MDKQKFSELVTNAAGRINSRALTREFFENGGNLALWEDFETKTAHVSDFPVGVRVGLYIDMDGVLPSCHCGAPVTVMDRKLSKYCSRPCMYSDPGRGAAISQRMKENAGEYDRRRRRTMLERYGVEYNTQREEIKQNQKSPLNGNTLSKLNDQDWMKEQFLVNGRSASDMAREIGVHYETVQVYLNKIGIVASKTAKIEGYLTQKKLEDALMVLFGKEAFVGREYQVPGTKKRWDMVFCVDGKNIVVEYDGDRHYMNSLTIKSDHEKDNIAAQNGFSVVRIPYWVQLTEETFAHYFGKIGSISQDYKHGFIDSNVFPASFCGMGVRRFEKEFNSLPPNVQKQIKLSMDVKSEIYGKDYVYGDVKI